MSSWLIKPWTHWQLNVLISKRDIVHAEYIVFFITSYVFSVTVAFVMRQRRENNVIKEYQSKSNKLTDRLLKNNKTSVY